MSRFSSGPHVALPRGAVVVLIVCALMQIGSAAALTHTRTGHPGAVDSGIVAATQGAPKPAVSVGSVVHTDSGTTGFGLLASVPAQMPWGSSVLDPANGWAYFGGQSNVTVLNGTSYVASINVGSLTGLGVYDPQNGFVYMVLEGNPEVAVINGSSLETVIHLVAPPSNYSHGIAYDPADGFVYVTAGQNVAIINGTNVTASLQLVSGGRSVWDLAYDASDGDVYADVGPGTITILNGTSNISYFPLVPAQSYPYSISYDRANGYVYVAQAGSGDVSIIQGSSYLGRVHLGGSPTNVVYNTTSGLAYVYGAGSNLSVFNGSSFSGNISVGLGVTGGAYNPSTGEFCWVGSPLTGNTSGSSLAVLTNGSTIVAQVPLGSGAQGGVFDPALGYFYFPEAAFPGAIAVLGVGTFYNVTFSAAGLPSGWSWSVALDGSVLSTNGSSVSADLANGSHTYSILSPNPAGGGPGNNSTGRFNWSETPLPYTGSVIVNGSDVVEPTLQFSITTAPVGVVFQEYGLPSNVTWSVTFNGTTKYSGPGNYSQLVFYALPGNYTYRIAGIPGWFEDSLPQAGTINITSAFANASAYLFEPSLFYTPVAYKIEISESGLPASTVLNVTVDGMLLSLVANGGPETLTWSGFANGSYSYTISDVPGWHQYNLSYRGHLIVAGGTQPIDGSGVGYAVDLEFLPVVYNVTFTEFGLPLGTGWTVTVGTTAYLSHTASLVAAVPNGTVSYTLTDISGWHQSTLPYAGTIQVAGQPVTELTFGFTQVAYSVQFVQSGLPVGTVWSVVLGSTAGYTDNSTLAFSEPNGSFRFSVGTVSGYHANRTNGTVTLASSGWVVQLAFSANPAPAAPLVPAWLMDGAVGAGLGALAGGLVAFTVGKARRGNSQGPREEAKPSTDPHAPP